MYRTLIIYASRHGSTEGAAKIISLVLGPSRLTRPKGFAEGYRDVSRAKGLSPEKLPPLPFSLNLLRIDLEKIESLNAKFATHGYDNKADHRFSKTID